MTLMQTLAVVETPNNRQSLLKALEHLSNCDEDFNGNNGPEYLWQQASDGNYNSNQQYVLDIIKDLPSDDDVVQAFLDYWVKHDSYYRRYECTVHKNQKDQIDAIAFAYVC